MAATLADLVALRELSPNVYETLANPEKMGNAKSIAFGGCTMAAAANAAHQNLPDRYRMYSFTGNYLGPALTERKLICSVREVRITRTFATRQVEVSQEQADGAKRLCLIAIADFQVPEPATLLMFSKPPSMDYSRVDDLPTTPMMRRALVDAGKISKGIAAAHAATFGLLSRHFDQRFCPEGVGSQNLMGMLSKTTTTQDHLPVTSKTTADWFKAKHMINDRAMMDAALAFVMDAAVSFISLTHSHMFFQDTTACSSLDFALRIFVNDLDLNEWHLREWKAITGGEGRAYGEAQLWDKNGKMVASMTQQSIVRPKQQKKANL